MPLTLISSLTAKVIKITFMKRKTIRFPVILLMVVFSFIVIFHACKKDFSRQPAVITDRVDKALSIAYGKIVDVGSGEISDYGFCWDTLSISPDLSTSTLKLGKRGNTGTFQGQLIGLKPSKIYHLRAFLMNNAVVIYGKLVDFTTSDLPVVVTSAVSEIGSTSAKCGGSVTSDGGSPVTARGICFNVTTQPDLNSDHTIDGAGTGEFISSLTGLTNNIKYYVKAYATNVYGTTYGGEVTFTAGQNVTLPVVNTTAITNITNTAATSGGNVTADGGTTVSARGVCWSTSTNPMLTNSHTTDGTGTGTFVSNLTDLILKTLYYARAYATNGLGTSYGNEITFTTLSSATLATVTTASVTNITQTTATSGGDVTSDGGATVTARGVCWSTSSSPTIANSHTTDGNSTGTFVSNLTGLTPNTPYYVRAYATNSIGTAYGGEMTFTTLSSGVLPTITTNAVTNITQTTATCGGNVTSDGGTTVTARGVCWSTSSSPTIANSYTTDGSGTGNFVSNLTSLTSNTLYYVRAYATNNAGTAYGNQVSFTTSSATFYIGQNYGGGIIFYIDGTSQHGLIASTTDQSTGAKWGCYGTLIGGTSTAIGTGQSNTTAIINGCSTAGIAARICDELVLNGYSDWFLSSLDELNQMYLHKSVIGGFSNNGNWSSSEMDANFAYFQLFGTGVQSGNSKGNYNCVRAIRAF
jgi:hypothetical protein